MIHWRTERSRGLLLVGSCCLGGCPSTAPFYLMETADVLKKGEISVTPVGGAGGPTFIAGTGLRIRGGLDGKQELGGEAMAAMDVMTNFALAGKVSWKRALHPAVALLGGAGAAYTRISDTKTLNEAYAGTDFGVVVSAPRPLDDSYRPYFGLRTSLGAGSGDLRGDKSTDWSLIFVPTVTVGVAVDIVPRSRLYLEAGYLGYLTRSFLESAKQVSYGNGGYFAIGATFFIGRS